MISVFAPSVLVATVFCLFGWIWLTWRNFSDLRFWFTLACAFAVIGYLFAAGQYIDIFYIKKTPQADSAMWMLFGRMLCHCITVLIFVYHYKGTLRR